MEFFVPHANGKEQEEKIYQGIKLFAAENTGWKIHDDRIFSLEYFHNGKMYYAEVGKKRSG